MRFNVQTIDIETPYDRAFDYIADQKNLPLWTNAFQSVSGNLAVMRTNAGMEEVRLITEASHSEGKIEWNIQFRDSSARALSRLLQIDQNYCIYIFVLLPPPVPLEALEGALEQQSKIVKEELVRLKNLLEW